MSNLFVQRWSFDQSPFPARPNPPDGSPSDLRPRPVGSRPVQSPRMAAFGIATLIYQDLEAVKLGKNQGEEARPFAFEHLVELKKCCQTFFSAKLLMVRVPWSFHVQ